MQTLFILLALIAGRVVDSGGAPVSYATVYPVDEPEVGTATNPDGRFSFTTTASDQSLVVVSFIGYEKQLLPVSFFSDQPTITLREQPIALEETVVSAKASKQKNKRKQMAYLLHQVMLQMEADFSKDPCEYRIVSDARMDSEGEAWGMEQMIARVVCLPGQGRTGDSIQFAGQSCKRYFRPQMRERADSIYSSATLENLNRQRSRKQQKHAPSYRDMAAAVDSGVVTHHELWRHGNVYDDFMQEMNHVNRWSVGHENEGETVLTYHEKHNYLGIFIIDLSRHYILDSESLSVRRFSSRAEMWVNIPFGTKLNSDQLMLLNMLNMSDREIEKFRLKKAHAVLHLNSIYSAREGHLYPMEKNMYTSAELTGSKQTNLEIPVEFSATQRVTQIRTQDVQPMTQKQMTRRVARKIVEIY